MKSGTIKLIYQDEVMEEKNYLSVLERDIIIENWRRSKGVRFERCYLQIRPDTKKIVESV